MPSETFPTWAGEILLWSLSTEPYENGVIHLVEVNDDVVRSAGREPDEIFSDAHVRLHVGHEGRYENEVALDHVFEFGIVLTKVDAAMALQHVPACLGFSVVMGERAVAGEVAYFAKPDLGGGGVLDAHARDAVCSTRLTGALVLMAFSRDNGNYLCGVVGF